MMERESLYKRVWGEGERVVLIHGGGIEDPGQTWSKQRELASQYQVIVPDRRGYGRSSARDLPWTFADDALDIRPLLAPRAHLVGFSVGGIIALLIAGRWPDSVHSLTVIEPPAFGLAADQGEVQKLVQSLRVVFQPGATPEHFLVNFMTALGWTPPAALRLAPQQRRGVEAMMQEPLPWDVEFPLETLAALTCPKLIVSGNWHPAFVMTADRLASYLHAERLLVDGAEHAAHKGSAFNDRLRTLMQSAVRC